MNRRVAYPFRTLSDAAVRASPWQVSLDGQPWQDADEYLADWDASSDLRVRRAISVVTELAASDLGIREDELVLALSVKIGTGAGRLPRRIVRRERVIRPCRSAQHEFELKLASNELSSVLDLSTEVSLAELPRVIGALSPARVGDRLWSDRARILLEGEEPRFPIETADLRALLGDSIAAEAPWYLLWSPHDWNRDFHGAVRLYLNENTPAFYERIENQDRAAIQCLLGDIMSQICEAFVLEADAADLMSDLEPGSLGAQAATWLRKAWPSKDLQFLRSMLENRPGLFRAAMLALADLGDSE